MAELGGDKAVISVVVQHGQGRDIADLVMGKGERSQVGQRG